MPTIHVQRMVGLAVPALLSSRDFRFSGACATASGLSADSLHFPPRIFNGSLRTANELLNNSRQEMQQSHDAWHGTSDFTVYDDHVITLKLFALARG